MPELVRNSEKMKQEMTDVNFDQEILVKQHLRTQLSLFRRAWLTDKGWK